MIKFLTGIFSSVFGKSFLKISLIIILVTGVISFGANYYKTSVAQSQAKLNAIVAAAHAAGVAETQRDIEIKTNDEIIKEIQRIALLTAETNSKIDKINSDSIIQKHKINSYNPIVIGIKHPELVEKWANETNNNLFTDIQDLTK